MTNRKMMMRKSLKMKFKRMENINIVNIDTIEEMFTETITVKILNNSSSMTFQLAKIKMDIKVKNSSTVNMNIISLNMTFQPARTSVEKTVMKKMSTKLKISQLCKINEKLERKK